MKLIKRNRLHSFGPWRIHISISLATIIENMPRMPEETRSIGGAAASLVR